MSEQDLLDFFQIFNSTELGINVVDGVISFTKTTNTYNVNLKVNNNKLSFTPHDSTLNNTHFSELLNKSKFTNVDEISELIGYITSLNPNNYCIICHNKLDFQSESLISCGSDECSYKYEELIVGNSVIEKFKQDADMCKFLLESAIDAVKCERKYDIFEPFPTHFLKYNTVGVERGKLSKLEGKNYDNAKDFEKLDKLIANLDIGTFHKYLELCNTDEELASKIGKDLYIFIRFVLMSCKVDIVKNDDMLGISSDKFKIYKINHPIDKDDEFKKLIGEGKTDFLFHGSRWCNWYSILRNGLKNCSSSKLMTAGMAYGNGIYLSGDINVSYGYGASGNKSIVGVFEIIDKQKYSKSGHQVYVCDNEKVLIQRYLLIIPSNTNCLQEINGIFNKKIHEEKLSATIKYNKKSIAKIMREYQQLMKMNSDKSGFRIEVDTDYPFLWKVFISKFDDIYPIAQDMKKFGVKEIELEIRFPEGYPFEPPFVRIVSPRFMHLTGHVTINGSFCNELLTEKAWVPTYTTESVITSLISEIIEGGGRLDPHKYNIPYSYEAAKADFIRVAKSHGWM